MNKKYFTVFFKNGRTLEKKVLQDRADDLAEELFERKCFFFKSKQAKVWYPSSSIGKVVISDKSITKDGIDEDWP